MMFYQATSILLSLFTGSSALMPSLFSRNGTDKTKQELLDEFDRKLDYMVGMNQFRKHSSTVMFYHYMDRSSKADILLHTKLLDRYLESQKETHEADLDFYSLYWAVHEFVLSTEVFCGKENDDNEERRLQDIAGDLSFLFVSIKNRFIDDQFAIDESLSLSWHGPPVPEGSGNKLLMAGLMGWITYEKHRASLVHSNNSFDFQDVVLRQVGKLLEICQKEATKTIPNSTETLVDLLVQELSTKNPGLVCDNTDKNKDIVTRELEKVGAKMEKAVVTAVEGE